MAQARSRMSMNSVDTVVGVNASEASIPIKWKIPIWKGLVLPGDCRRSKRFQHDSLPGIFWQISFELQPDSRLSVYLIFSVSHKKSAATAVSAGFSISLESDDGKGTPMQLRLPTRIFNQHQFYGDYICSAIQRDQLMSYESIVVSGEITLQLPLSGDSVLRQMYESGRFGDLILKARSLTFYVHKSVIYKECPAILNDETRRWTVDLEIDSTPEAVKAVLQYIYGDPLSFAGLQDLSCEVLDLADKFQLPPLKRTCEAALIDSIDCSNVIKLAGFAAKIKTNDLKMRAFEFAANNVGDLVWLPDWSSLKKEQPLVAMSFCEFIIERLYDINHDQVISSNSATHGAATVPLEVPVRWEIADFKNLMEKSKCGSSITCKEKFSHASLPGIAWELILYPNGKEDNSHHVALFMRPIPTSNKKSQATAPSGGFTFRFEPADVLASASRHEQKRYNQFFTQHHKIPFEKTLPVQQFGLKSELGIAKFARQSQVDATCLARNGSAILRGKIFVEPPSSDQILSLRRLLENSKHADFTIKADDESFHVHKNILSGASPAMEAMFDTDCEESDNDFVEIKETTVEAVRALLQFWYGDPLSFDGLEDLSMDVYKLADRYQDFKLRQICVDALSRMASRENVVHLAAFAADQSCEPLEKVAARIIIENADILKQDAWAQFKQENFKLALTVAERIVMVHHKPLRLTETPELSWSSSSSSF